MIELASTKEAKDIAGMIHKQLKKPLSVLRCLEVVMYETDKVNMRKKN